MFEVLDEVCVPIAMLKQFMNENDIKYEGVSK